MKTLKIELLRNCITKKLVPPVSENKAYATAGSRRVKSKALKEWQEFLRQCFMIERLIDPQPLPALFFLHIHCTFPTDKKKRDASNYIKPIQDALINVLYEDDSQVRTASADSEPGKEWGLSITWMKADCTTSNLGVRLQEWYQGIANSYNKGEN